MMLSAHYFGDVEAIDEGQNHTKYFLDTFIPPSSFSMTSLNNKNKYIIVGRKGSGKTATQFKFSEMLRDNRYLTHFFSFHNDVKNNDYVEAAKTQKVDILSIIGGADVALNYDFRDIWTRTFLVKIAETILASGSNSKFVSFAIGNRHKLSSVFEGILKSTNIKLSGELGVIAGEVGIDLSKLKDGVLPLEKFVKALMILFAEHHKELKLYLFVDELVFSRLNAVSDEFKMRSAMVRDILRVTRDLNNSFAQNNIDVHVVCNIRPEIRDVINELDAEIGKVFDGKSVNLQWMISDEPDSPLMNILRKKIECSLDGTEVVAFDKFFCKNVTFAGKPQTISAFLTSNTWGRPRDIIQLLNSIQYCHPNKSKITEEELKSSLTEYSRRCFIEILEEVSVTHGPNVSKLLRENVKQREYLDCDDFQNKVLKNGVPHNQTGLMDDLFRFGFIGSIDKSHRYPRFYWAHRGDTHFDRSLPVQIHFALRHHLHLQ